jgi:hypothetical protein
LIAVLSTGSYADSEDLIGALFGQDVVVLRPRGDDFDTEWTRAPNGLWSPARNRRVLRCHQASGLAPWSVQTESPRLWLNPWAERPLELECDWLAPTPISLDGQLTFASAPLAADAFFALPPAWPGPEKPFA